MSTYCTVGKPSTPVSASSGAGVQRVETDSGLEHPFVPLHSCLKQLALDLNSEAALMCAASTNVAKG